MATQQIENGDKTFTSIQISIKNRDRIRKIGVMGEDYNDVVAKLLDLYEQKVSQ